MHKQTIIIALKLQAGRNKVKHINTLHKYLLNHGLICMDKRGMFQFTQLPVFFPGNSFAILTHPILESTAV